MDLEAVAQPGGEHGRAVDVFADVFGAAGIMENHREIERVGILDLMEQTPVDLILRVVFRNELIELFDAAQSVFVRGVAVEKLVLDEAVQRTELGQVAAEEADAVHQAQDARDVALAFEDRLEYLAVGFCVAERPVDISPVVGDETADLGAELEVAHLAMLEQSHQTVRVFLENVRVRREQAPIPGDEAVEFLAALAPEC